MLRSSGVFCGSGEPSGSGMSRLMAASMCAGSGFGCWCCIITLYT